MAKKGIITFYINYHPDIGQDPDTCVEIARKCNKDIVDKIHAEGDYHVMFIATTKESCRVEKIDFEKPHPRYSSKSHNEIFEEEQ